MNIPDIYHDLEVKLLGILTEEDAARPELSPDLVMESQKVQHRITEACQDVRIQTGLEFEVQMQPPAQKGGSWTVRVVTDRNN